MCVTYLFLGQQKPATQKSVLNKPLLHAKCRLKKRAKQQLIARMGVDPENNWEAEYQILPGKEKVVEELQRLAKDADQIYLATDLDREGEAIAWHLREIIGDKDKNYRRVVFNEI